MRSADKFQTNQSALDLTKSKNKEKRSRVCSGIQFRFDQTAGQSARRNVANFVIEQLEGLSFAIKKITVVVLDNARIHTGRQMRERIGYWQQRGLFIFYLPTYSPHLNIAETVWRKLKYEWLAPTDYEDGQRLRYSVKQALNEFGKSLRINFSDFNHSLN